MNVFFRVAAAYQGAARDFPCGPGAVTLVPLSVPEALNPRQIQTSSAHPVTLFSGGRGPDLFEQFFFPSAVFPSCSNVVSFGMKTLQKNVLSR